MTLATSKRKINFVSDGVVRTFDFDFKIFETEDIKVSYSSADGIVHKVPSGDYSVFIGENGGTVTLNDPIEENALITIYRELTPTQKLNIPINGRFPAEAVETALDRGTMSVQELMEELKRAIKLPIAVDVNGKNLTIPSTNIANKVLAFDAEGNITTYAKSDFQALNHYELWLKNGNSGTFDDYINDLRGQLLNFSFSNADLSGFILTIPTVLRLFAVVDNDNFQWRFTDEDIQYFNDKTIINLQNICCKKGINSITGTWYLVYAGVDSIIDLASFKGDKGSDFKYTDFTNDQLNALKVKGDIGATGATGKYVHNLLRNCNFLIRQRDNTLSFGDNSNGGFTADGWQLKKWDNDLIDVELADSSHKIIFKENYHNEILTLQQVFKAPKNNVFACDINLKASANVQYRIGFKNGSFSEWQTADGFNQILKHSHSFNDFSSDVLTLKIEIKNWGINNTFEIYNAQCVEGSQTYPYQAKSYPTAWQECRYYFRRTFLKDIKYTGENTAWDGGLNVSHYVGDPMHTTPTITYSKGVTLVENVYPQTFDIVRHRHNYNGDDIHTCNTAMRILETNSTGTYFYFEMSSSNTAIDYFGITHFVVDDSYYFDMNAELTEV